MLYVLFIAAVAAGVARITRQGGQTAAASIEWTKDPTGVSKVRISAD